MMELIYPLEPLAWGVGLAFVAGVLWTYILLKLADKL